MSVAPAVPFKKDRVARGTVPLRQEDPPIRNENGYRASGAPAERGALSACYRVGRFTQGRGQLWGPWACAIGGTLATCGPS